MKLLIVTQVVDEKDGALGFFIDWIREFSEQCDEVEIICLRSGQYSLPKNVTVIALDDNGRESAFKRWKRYLQLLKHGLAHADMVFFHMCPEYVVAGIPALIRFSGRKVLWYTHASVTWKLRVAEKCVDSIMTAAKESLRINTKKKCVMGHGIPISRFQSVHELEEGKLRLLAIGRVTSVKDILTLIKSFKLLLENFSSKEVSLTIAGETHSHEDKEYREMLNRYVEKNNLENTVHFIGRVEYEDMPKLYSLHDIEIHAATAGLDKVILEGLASGMTVITANPNADFLPDEMRFKEGDEVELSKKIKMMTEQKFDSMKWRTYIEKNHGLKNLISSILSSK